MVFRSAHGFDFLVRCSTAVEWWLMEHSREEITKLLSKWSRGDEAALHQLVPLVYRELHKLGKHYMQRQEQGHTLQTTALIHEAYIKLIGNPEKHWNSRMHFFAVAARAMRHVLVDHERARGAGKRGGQAIRVNVDETAIVSPEP